jgi:hypothetical protein
LLYFLWTRLHFYILLALSQKVFALLALEL